MVAWAPGHGEDEKMKHSEYVCWWFSWNILEHDDLFSQKYWELNMTNYLFFQKYMGNFMEFHHPNWLSLWSFSEWSLFKHQPAMLGGQDIGPLGSSAEDFTQRLRLRKRQRWSKCAPTASTASAGTGEDLCGVFTCPVSACEITRTSGAKLVLQCEHVLTH